MATQEYKIRYRDKRTQSVEADTYNVYNGRYVFSRDDIDVLSIAEDSVESVAVASVADPEQRPLKSAGV